MSKQSTVINVLCVFKSLLQYVKITKEDEWTQKKHFFQRKYEESRS